MKLLKTFLLVGALLAASSTFAGDPDADRKALIEKIKTGIGEGNRTAKSLASEIKEFDVLLKKYEGQKTDAVAQILFTKAMLYVEVFQDVDSAIPMVKQVKKDFPDTKFGKDAERIIEVLESRREMLKVQANMAEGKTFPDFKEKDLAGKPLSIGQFKGKVVLVDFWATWCGPCVAEMPNVTKAYNKYHKTGFEVIGISLDSDRGRLDEFLKENKMPWPQFYDGNGWKNKLAQRYGVNSIPATYLIGTDGKIIAKNLRGHALEAAVGKALAKK
ncbi:MAG: TlpA family protein disulfide reductase [Limisphaerales bacterium]